MTFQACKVPFLNSTTFHAFPGCAEPCFDLSIASWRLFSRDCPRLALSGAEDGVEDGSEQVDCGSNEEHVTPRFRRLLYRHVRYGTSSNNLLIYFSEHVEKSVANEKHNKPETMTQMAKIKIALTKCP